MRPRCVENLRRNLRRVFDDWGVQAQVARDANTTPVYIAQLLSGVQGNPSLAIVEAIAISLEIPIETLISNDPPDHALRIRATKKSLLRA